MRSLATPVNGTSRRISGHDILVYSDKAGKGTGYAMVQPAVLSDPTVVASTTVVTSGQGGVPGVTLTR